MFKRTLAGKHHCHLGICLGLGVAGCEISLIAFARGNLEGEVGVG